jgi:hypothetical protein
MNLVPGAEAQLIVQTAFDHHIASAIDGQHADANPEYRCRTRTTTASAITELDITSDDGGTGSLWWATKNESLGLLGVAGRGTARRRQP